MPARDELSLSETADRITRLEERLARIEAQLAREGVGVTPRVDRAEPAPPSGALAPVFGENSSMNDEFELELGQHWFALAGIAGLTAGFAFLLSLPYPTLPAAVPAVGGAFVSAGLAVAARLLPTAWTRVADYLVAAAMTLFAFSALRLSFMGATPVIAPTSLALPVCLLATSAVNLLLAWQRRSGWLAGVALTVASAAALASGSALLVLVTITVATVVAVGAARHGGRTAVVLLAMALTYVTYLLWASGNPLRGAGVHFIATLPGAPVLFAGLLLALGGSALSRADAADDLLSNAAAVLTCTLGYGAFLVHTAAAFPASFAWAHALAALAFIGLAAAYFVRAGSRVATFLYAMTGYLALSFALLKLASAPAVFIWLSLESVVVVATAIWFRSRFIVVANFFMFAVIVGGYMLLSTRETGISLCFGVVALATARILNWQQHRLELKTELMRNAYLVSAFAIFPYAASHLVPARYVALLWTALAGLYYLLNLGMRNQKYRWMGHGTLVLATVYAAWVGVSRLEPVYRVLTFLVLGAALLSVSLILTRTRRRGATALPPADHVTR